MKLATFDDGRVGVVEDGSLRDVTGIIPQGAPGGAMRRLIAAWPGLRDDVRHAQGPRIPLTEAKLEAPVPDPSTVWAAPVNYVDHQGEMQQARDISSMGLFLKAPSSVVGDGAVIRLPYSDRRFDQEGELACIIGRRARRLSEDEALSYVFGYTAALDITMRGGEDRSTRKSFETFTPLGPWIVTADEFGDPEAVDLRCTVSGTLKQAANTRELIWGVARLVSYASWVTTLQPGDVLLTGTPAGVDALYDGDDIVVELERLGRPLRARVSAAGAVLSHTSGHSSGPTPPPATRPSR